MSPKSMTSTFLLKIANLEFFAAVELVLRGHVSKHWALSVERVESPKIYFSLIFGHMEAYMSAF